MKQLEQAVTALAEIVRLTAEIEQLDQQRDMMIRAARQAGASIREIAAVAHTSPTTIHRRFAQKG